MAKYYTFSIYFILTFTIVTFILQVKKVKFK